MRVGAMFLVLGLGLCLCRSSAVAQDVPTAEVFVGYSYLNFDVNDLGPRQSANGWETSLSANINRPLAIEADFSGYYKDVLGVSVQDYGFLGGPRFNFRPAFVHALFGGDRLSGAGLSQTSFAMALGGGVQVPINRQFAVRGSADYVLTQHNIFGGAGVNQNNFRASVGVVFTFGNREDGRARGPLSPHHEEERWCVDESDAPLLGVRGCSVPNGFRVTSVKKESAGERAGLTSGDIIVAVDDRPIRDAREVEAAVAANPGGTVKLSYLIKGNWKTDREVKVR